MLTSGLLGVAPVAPLRLQTGIQGCKSPVPAASPISARRHAASANHTSHPRRASCRTRALGDGTSEAFSSGATTADAHEVASWAMGYFCAGDPSSVIPLLSNAALDNALERKRSKLEDQGAPPGTTATFDEDLTLTELIELAPPTALSIDAYAMRGVVLAAPASSAPLSTLRISPGRCLQRFAITTHSGEEMSLTFDLALEEALEPRYRSFGVVQKWFIRGIAGEPSDGGLPDLPARRHSPEAVVAAQLAALKSGDVTGVFQFASLRNRAAFDGSVERFGQMLGSEGYAPLLNHAAGEVLRSTQMTPGRCFAVVGVTAGGPIPQRTLYGWSLALQAPEAGEVAGCWLVEAVYPLGYGPGFFAL